MGEDGELENGSSRVPFRAEYITRAGNRSSCANAFGYNTLIDDPEAR
jgi:hypothetical protein